MDPLRTPTAKFHTKRSQLANSGGAYPTDNPTVRLKVKSGCRQCDDCLTLYLTEEIKRGAHKRKPPIPVQVFSVYSKNLYFQSPLDLAGVIDSKNNGAASQMRSVDKVARVS